MGTDLYPGIINTVINAASWTAITIPSGVNGFSLLRAKTRDNTKWYLSDTAVGTNYQTVGIESEEDIVAPVGATLFYAKGTTATTLEVLLRK